MVSNFCLATEVERGYDTMSALLCVDVLDKVWGFFKEAK